MTDELDKLYTDLQRAYDLTLDRKKTLTGQAASLMSFAGIIQTVLIGLMITLATNKDARALLHLSSYYSEILILIMVGFASYMLTAIFSLLAFKEPKWEIVPQMPDNNPLDSIQFFYSGKGKYSLEKIAMQLSDATEFHQKTNKCKFIYLQLGLLFLMVGIIVTAFGGYLILATLS